MMSKKKAIVSARYVQAELGIRLAREVQSFHELPYCLVCSPHVKQVFDLYLMAFKTLTNLPEIDSAELEEQFSSSLANLVDSFSGVVYILAEGISEAVESGKIPPEFLNVQKFMDRFVINRIARRVLAEQHLVLRKNLYSVDFTGVLVEKCGVMKCIQEAMDVLTEECKSYYGFIPTISVDGDLKATIPYIEQHLVYILLELLSNSVSAVYEKHKDKLPNVPKIDIFIATGTRTVTIRISDRGGGIPLHIKERAFQYGFSTRRKPDLIIDPVGMKGSRAHGMEPIGRGFGLPLARLYAKHFGGDLRIESLDGYGTDLILTLDRTGDVLENFEL
uniref:Protein-serine/threonine kinase n=1 Tax=Arcella intermedia TaxID=1963864 RepID=A0A6B2L8K4_9EUKA